MLLVSVQVSDLADFFGSYAAAVHHFVEHQYVAITCIVLPFLLMLIDGWLKHWRGFDWKTYGADAALCGLATLSAAVFASVWTVPNSEGAAFLILFFHGCLWTTVLWLASKYHHFYQAVTGAIVCCSCFLFALYYLHQSGG
jgi:hypothetical protein